MNRLRLVPALAALAALAAAPAQAGELPLLGAETPRGEARTVALAPAAPTEKMIDGLFGDWTGRSPMFAGSLVRSHGELIYTDHLFDAFGPDDGRDAERLANLKPVHDAAPQTYRLDAIMQNDPAGQVGAPQPAETKVSKEHGNLGLQDKADLVELRVAPDGDEGLALLARTTTMTAATDTAVLVLLDTAAGDTERTIPFGANLKSRKTDVAVLLAGDRGWVADLATGVVEPLPAGSVATRPDGYDNAVEARLPGLAGATGVAAATGRQNAAGDRLANVANVAFRTAEPVREFFEREQALALHAGSIDGFFAPLDAAALRAGANETWVPAPGYHERVFVSDAAISEERGSEGIRQHYGVYLPQRWEEGREQSLQLWLHWRGGAAHSAGNVIPALFDELGERKDAIVISPRGRGSSSWYVGRGHADVLEVWKDAHARFEIDEDRRYVAGHSMGGWGSFLFTITHPDWFAAALPASPPSTQGAFTGIDAGPVCDTLSYDDYSPCYIEANGGDARTQHTYRLLENVRHVPWAIFHGTADELVPTPGVARQHERLLTLGYRHRLYLFHTQEHFGPPVWDQWREGANYMHDFVRDANPARVSFVRDMPFENAIARGLALDFDRAYWLKGIEPRDAAKGVAKFEGRSLAIREQGVLGVPEAGGPAAPGQTGPYTMTGWRWQANPVAAEAARSNGFEVTATGARELVLDGDRMKLDPARTVTAKVTTDGPVRLVLRFGEREVESIVSGAGTHELTFAP